MDKRHCVAFIVLCCVIGHGSFAQAANGTGNGDACTPLCRDGFYCSNGQCVSPCNPGCPALEVCTRNGKCIPEVPLEENRVQPPAPYQEQIGAGKPLTPINYTPPAQYPYSTGTGPRITGTVFLIIGLVNLVTAPICLSDAVGSEMEEACLIGSLTVGGLFTVMGIPLLASGNAKRKRYREWRKQQQSTIGYFSVDVSKSHGGLFWTRSF